MLKRIHVLSCARMRQRGTTLVEVLVALLIGAIGLLALAGLQTRMNMAVLESYQRAQAVSLLKDMAQRIDANAAQLSTYVTSSPAGIGDSEPSDCSTLATPTRARLDRCEWSNALKGAAEALNSQSAGGVLGGRGCVEQVQVADASVGVCRPGVVRVSVVWQGFIPTVAPEVGCAATSYGSSTALRKAVSALVTAPLPGCS